MTDAQVDDNLAGEMAAIATPPGLVLEAKQGGVVVLRLDRPRRANAIDRAMHTRLCSLWPELSAVPSVRAVILTGAGDIFCGGGDRQDWPEVVEDRAWRTEKMAEARRIVVEMLRFPLPLVAAVNGPAVGLGCSLAIAADVMLMAEGAYLRDTHVPTGLVAGDGGAALLPEMLPLPVARRLLFTGDRLEATEAHALWLASDVVARDALAARAHELASRLAALPREALVGTKRALNLGVLARALPVLDFSSLAEEACFDAPEFRAAHPPREQSRDGRDR